MISYDRMSAAYNLEELEALARGLALRMERGDIITLSGEVGAGKTTFARALIQALSAEPMEITSPTFTLMQSYDVKLPGGNFVTLWHLDLYRLKNQEESQSLGLEELWPHIVLIEWPEIIKDLLPKCRLDIFFEFSDNPNARTLVLSGDETWQNRLESIK